MADKSAEYYKSLQPAQLIAERGPELVVINPGSHNVRIGLASWQAPAVVPHCVAWHMPSKSVANDQKKGAVGELFQPEISNYAQSNRDDLCDKIESDLGVRHYTLDENSGDQSLKSGQYYKCDDKSPEMMWTQVAVEGTQKFRKCICGEEALKIPASQPYCLRRPIRRGRLNVSAHYSMQQVCDDLHAIWDWALMEKLEIGKKSREKFSAVLVVADTVDNRATEVKEMLSVLLKDLGFQSAVVHQECVAATFGNGASCACVVHIGAQVTSVTCVEDGVSISMTHRVLPYGGEDISKALLWVQKRHHNWPPIATNSSTDPLDLLMLNSLKENHCAITNGDLDATADVYSYTAGKSAESYKIHLIALNVPPLGLFYPPLLAPEEQKHSTRPWYYVDHEDMLIDPGEAVDNEVTTTCSDEEESMMGLHEAIADSILSMGRVDLKSKFFSSIQLVGGVAWTRGLADAVEERVAQCVPANEGIERVEVVANRMDPSVVCWKGGVIGGVLDMTRDAWIQREDWIEGVMGGRKYKDSSSLHAQAFWYNAVLE